MLGPAYVTTMSVFDEPDNAKENTTEAPVMMSNLEVVNQGIKHENEPLVIDWPGALATLIEIGIIEVPILSRVELNKPSSIELRRGT